MNIDWQKLQKALIKPNIPELELVSSIKKLSQVFTQNRKGVDPFEGELPFKLRPGKFGKQTRAVVHR